jgi:hypothetical protein
MLLRAGRAEPTAAWSGRFSPTTAPAWYFDCRPATAGNTDAERKVCGIWLRAEKRVGELLKELARATPAEAATKGNATQGKNAPPTAGVASPYTQALTDNISSQTASRNQALAAVPVGDLPRYVGQAPGLFIRLGRWLELP